MTHHDTETRPSHDAMQTTIARHIADVRERWRGCESRGCRRARRCVDAQFVCVADAPVARISAARDVHARASLRRMIDAEMIRRGIAR